MTGTHQGYKFLSRSARTDLPRTAEKENRRVHRKGSLHECEQNHHLIANIAVEPWFFHLLRTTSRDLRRSHEPPQTVVAERVDGRRDGCYKEHFKAAA